MKLSSWPLLKLQRILLATLGSVLLILAFFTSLSPAPLLAQGSCEEIKCEKGAQSEDDYLSCTKQKQSCWENKIKESQTAAVTLSNTIAILNGQIKVQELQIEQTLTEIAKLEKQIVELSNRISGLNVSLDRLTTLLVEKVRVQYKRSRLSPLQLFLKSESFKNGLIQFKYLALTRAQTAKAMQQAEAQRQTYDEQKNLKEAKQAEIERKKQQLEKQQAGITKQRSEQQFLLQETKNNESRYQNELAKTLAELDAIQSIIAGRGSENKVGSVNQGDKIASIIVGSSPCSTGSHLHFEVVKDGAHRDPAGYLKGISAEWNNAPDSSFGFGGGWEWPLDNPAKINQGYGMTYYARVRRAYGGAPHTGIDMVSKDAGNYTVKAVKPGDLFRGSIQCGSGLLRYVKVEHKEDGVSTYYLHVNY